VSMLCSLSDTVGGMAIAANGGATTDPHGGTVCGGTATTDPGRGTRGFPTGGGSRGFPI